MDKRMAGDYEIIQSFHIGDQEVVIGENLNAPPEERYMCAFCQQNEIVALYNDVLVSDDFCEIAKLYGERLARQAEKTRVAMFKPKFQGIDTTPLTKADCTPLSHEDDLNDRVVVIKPEVLRREYQMATNQIKLCTGGFGASPNSRGSACFCVDLYSGKEYSVATIKKTLDEEYRETYRQWIYEMSRLQNINRETIDCLMRQKVNELLKIKNPQAGDTFGCLPAFFLDACAVVSQTEKSEKNVFIDPIRERRIEFDTIHGVKGETHDATLYLETDRKRASDLNRILPYYGAGKLGDSKLFDDSRKLAYVGMSRPKKLLCVAMQAKTYEKSKGVFADDWEIIDLRE